MMEIIDIYAIKNTLPKIHKGVKKYINIMNDFHKCDVSQDLEFQRTYNGFYRIRQRPQEFYRIYYGYMEAHKSYNLTFEDVISYLHKSTSRFEPSFSSKMLATINPNMPVWDSIVLSHLSINPPQDYLKDSKERLRKRIEIYNNIVKWYDNYLKTQNSKEVICLFDELFQNTQITDVKKIDLALWSLG